MYELDGLKPHPIDHGLIEKSENWTEKFKKIIVERINLTNQQQQQHQHLQQSNNQSYFSQQQQPQQYSTTFQNHHSNGSYLNHQQQQNTEIRFNLMALVPDKLNSLKENLDLLTNNRTKLLNVIDNLVKSESQEDLSNENHQQQQQQQQSDNNTRQLRSRVSSSSTLTATTVNVNSNSSPSKIDLLCTDNSFKFKIKLKNALIDELTNRNQVNEILFNDFEIIRLNSYIVENNDNNDKMVLKFKDLIEMDAKFQSEIQYYENKWKEEIEKRNKYKVSSKVFKIIRIPNSCSLKVDAMRRKHRYDEFIVTYLRMLAENGKLTKLIQTQLDSVKKRKTTTTTNHLAAAGSIRLTSNKIKRKMKKK